MSGNATSALTDLSRVGLGYGIAIAVGILVLITTIMLASYVCVRVHGHSQHRGMMFHGNVNDASAVRVTIDGHDHVTGQMPGLDQETLDTYPKLQYSQRSKSRKEAFSSCSICLCDYKDSDLLRLLPDCRHVFHVGCIDAWMKMNATCPMCRSSPLASPLSTPLTELLPLARNSGRIQR